MKVGICAGIEMASRVSSAGFDYLEVGLANVAAAVPFDPSVWRAAGAKTANFFFPAGIALYAEDPTPWRHYAKEAIDRAADVGLEVLVVGSGRQRFAPEGMDPQLAEARFVEVVAEIHEIAQPKGLRIAPESLNRSETNVGNDLPRLRAALAERGVGYTVDTYHALYEWRADGGTGELPADFWRQQVPTLPDHVHVSSIDRRVPEPEDPQLTAFAAHLAEINYAGRVSLEANWGTTDEELALAARQLRALFG